MSGPRTFGATVVAGFLLASFAAIGTVRADVSIHELPPGCSAYTSIPPDARDDIAGWNQLLSLASCVQSAAISPIADADQLQLVVDRETRALAIPMSIYFAALENGPGPVQLRAAYQLGMAHVALIVRTRSAIGATEHAAELHAQLELLLARSYRLAWWTFAVIDGAVTEDPTLAPDPVTQNMLRSARAMLAAMPEPVDTQPESPGSYESAKTASWR